MKKLISLLFLLIFSQVVIAAQADRLEISIKNAGSTDCVLKKQYPLFGHISDHTQVPEVIFRNQMAVFSMRSNRKLSLTTSILVTYECGDEQEITLFSGFLTHVGFEQKVFDAKNMQASVTTEDSPYFSTTEPWKIHWVITNSVF